MSWVRLDDLLPHHRKLVACGAAAPMVFGWYVASIAFANRHFTDGVILPGDLSLLLPSTRPRPAMIDQLVAVRFWDVRPEGGWVIHDFLEHNNSAEYRRTRARADADRKRRGFQADSERIPHGVHADSEQIPCVEPSREEKRRAEPSSLPPISPPSGGFVRFWTAYPKKVGKEAARRAWRTHRCEPLTQAILDGLARQRAYLERDGGQYIPNPATWLNAGRWQDEPPDLGRPGDAKTRENVAGIQAWLEAQGGTA